MTLSEPLEHLITQTAHPYRGSPRNLDPLVEQAADRRFVLLGEASHGTHEFYRVRAELTKRLIEEHGFSAVLVEADWPDAYRVNRYVQHARQEPDASEALGDFERYPRWMWRNEDVVELVEWMRVRDRDHAPAERAGFYGFDLYSLHRSMNAVIDYLDEHNPDAARRARERYACFDHFGPDAQAYGYAAGRRGAETCEDEVVEQLVELEQNRAQLLTDKMRARDGTMAEEEFFFAEQNARVAKNAEEYYRSMYYGRASTWNLRDQHMAETASSLLDHLQKQGRTGKAIIWAHNSHLGDARATAMSRRGEHNVGQLLRQRFGDEVLNVGFTTYEGAVTASSNWGSHAEYKRVRPGLAESFEALFHRAGPSYFLLDLHADAELDEALAEPRLERAIGVIYRPETERVSHYFDARLSEQFDWVIHMDVTSAVVPLDPSTLWQDAARGGVDMPETYPFGL
jgi:erythromycin esterase-like protein